MHNKIWLIIISCITAAGLLVSCATTHKDGPPGYNVDVSRIPNAVPKKEPLSKYGNMRSYEVFGKRYYPLKSSHNYDKVGTASWYGTKFHSRLTSSGERYDMLSMTAAHKTLPLPTYVEVTNLKNNRKVVVKVNDRGPFSSNRLIDLSYVAAKKLGMLGHGTTEVRIRAIDPDSFNKPMRFARNKNTSFENNFYHPSENKAENTKGIYLQVGAYKTRSYAQRMKSRLSHKVDAPILISRSNTGARLYRVRVGPIKDESSVTSIENWLANLGIKAHQVM